MRLSLTLVDGRTGRPVDALVDFDTAQPLGDLVPALVRLLGEQVHDSFARRVPVWVDGVEADQEQPAGLAGVHNGAVLSLFEPADRVARVAPPGVAEVRVVSGPGAGRVHRLPLGETVIGNGAAGWSLPDLRLPSRALTVAVAADGEVTVTPGPTCTAELDGQPLTEEGAPWPVGGYLAAGGTVLARADLFEPTADVEARPDEALVDFNRPPRLLPPERERVFHLPDPPSELRKRPIPWVMVLVPLVVAVPMAFLFSWRYLIFALLSPVMILANFFSDRKQGRKEALAKQAKYDETLEAVNARIEAGLLAEQSARRMSSPDPATLLIHALGPGPRLWERRHTDPDYLRVRIGLADLPAEIRVEERRDKTDEEAAPRVLDLVPVWLDLKQVGVLGVAGDQETAPSLAHWFVAQTALLHSPRDVRIVVLSDAEGEDAWGWVRWLPHARLPGETEAVALGTQQDSVGRRLAELTGLLAAREAAAQAKVRPTPDLLVVLDGARRLRTLPAVVDLLRRGPAVGIRVLCVEDEVRQLPEECRAVVACAAGEVRLEATAVEDTDGIAPDLVEVPWCETVARSISHLRDTTPEEEASGLPDSARLLEEIQLDPPTPEGVAQRWRHGRTTDVVVGAGYDGPFRIDLRRDGPHALIAGTTGSGKSEFLQTLVASLAVANRPDELTFVLVDYKGGSAFKDCERLPHTVGMVTDLDTHLVGRALVSLGAELRRREHLLAVPGAKDLEDYWALQRSQPDLPPIPRLVLVIDEFASMVAELPDFVNGLVSIAQRGRSLGIHLVLATQRPSGVVSADIKANTNLRISLRVTDETDSRDVLDAPDAARILKNQPGRAFVRSGASTLMPFQSGRVGGRSPDATEGPKTPDEALAWPVPWSRVGLPAPERPKVESAQTDEADTDLAAVVDAINTLNRSLGIPEQHRPWLDALPDLVRVEDLPPFEEEASGRLAAAWALEDLPALQEQRPKTFELGRDGHLYVIGGPRSGRSTALRTLAGALADRVGVADLHVYALDCGNGSLLGLSNLPHTGAVVTRTQVDRAGRLLSRLVSVVEERQQLLGRGGFADLAELRASLPEEERPPYLLFLLDRWDGFSSTLGEVDTGRMTEQVLTLLRDGASVGLHVVIAGDRSLVVGKTSTLVENRVVLRLADKGDYSTVGIHTRDVPDTLVDGRALEPDPVREFQVATLSDDISGAGQNAALRDIAARHAERDAAVSRSRRPFRLEEMPAVAAYDDVRDAVGALAGRVREGWLPLGIGGDDLDLLGLDLSGSPVAVVAGPPKSGRTGVLRFAAAVADEAGTPVLALCPVDNALHRTLAPQGASLLTAELEEDDLVERLRGLAAGTVVLVDDAELISKDGPLGQAMMAMMQQARGKGWRVLVAGSTTELGSGFSGWLYEARKARQGLMLSPQGMGDGEVFSTRLMRSAMMPRVHPGRGLVIDSGGGQQLVQVPLVD